MKYSRRGMTLIEVMVGTVIALILTAAAVSFATQQVRLMDVSQERLEMSSVGRAALNLVANDVRKAGMGLGYNERGEFLGLDVGAFTQAGLNWNGVGGTPAPDGDTPPLDPGVYAANIFVRPGSPPYTVRSTDLRVRYADGTYSTVVTERNLIGVACLDDDANGFLDGELTFMSDATGLSGMSGTMGLGSTFTGAGCACEEGCVRFTFTPTADVTTGASAMNVRYQRGEIRGGLTTVLWHVSPNAAQGELYRATVADGDVCANRLECGALVANNVEALNVQVWRFDETTDAWVNAGQEPVSEYQRIRVDLELVVRSDEPTGGPKPLIESRLRSGTCIPAACGSAPGDDFAREAYRTSVEVMNGGIGSFR